MSDTETPTDEHLRSVMGHPNPATVDAARRLGQFAVEMDGDTGSGHTAIMLVALSLGFNHLALQAKDDEERTFFRFWRDAAAGATAALGGNTGISYGEPAAETENAENGGAA